MNQLGKRTLGLSFHLTALVLALLVGCSGWSHDQDPSWTLVQITDVKTVEGNWEGPIKKEDAFFAEGTVRLMIRGNGTYVFVGQSVSKVALGAGSLKVQDGRLIGDTDRRALTFLLYDHNGKPVIVVQSNNLETGARYDGEFTKIQ